MSYGCGTFPGNYLGNPIGGGLGYSETYSAATADYVATTAAQLKSYLAAATSGQVVYVADGATITLNSTADWYSTGVGFYVKAGVILAGGRGRSGVTPGIIALGAGFYNTSVYRFIRLQAGSRLIGLHIKGPQDGTTGGLKWYSVRAYGNGAEVANCEIHGFGAGRGPSVYYATDFWVHHCYIHHIQQSDAYGIGVQGSNYDTGTHASVLAEGNHFDYMVQTIAGSYGLASYTFRYNYCGANQLGKACDMHGQNDGYLTLNAAETDYLWPAGVNVDISYNTSLSTSKGFVRIKGVPTAGGSITVHNNWTYHAQTYAAAGSGGYWGAIAQQMYNIPFDYDQVTALEYNAPFDEYDDRLLWEGTGTVLVGHDWVRMTEYDNWFGSTPPSEETALSPSLADGVSISDTASVTVTGADEEPIEYIGLTETGELVVDGLTARGRFVEDGLTEQGLFAWEAVSEEEEPPVEVPVFVAAVMIDSAAYTILKDSLSIETRIEERSTASFTVIDLDGDCEFSEGYPVELWDPAETRIFGGVIDSFTSYRLSASGGLFHDISCCDYHYFADKRRAAESYESRTAGFIVTDLLNKYLSEEGVGLGEIQAGPTVTEMVINYARVTDAIDALAERAGFIWYIDENKKLYFIDRATNTAPWAFSNYKAVSTPTLSRGNPQYRNRQFVRGTSETDAQTETFAGDGDVKSFACGYPLATVPTITVSSVAQTVGIKGLDSDKQFYWSKGDSIITAETAPAAAAAVVVSYTGTYPIMVLADDLAAITIRKATERTGTGYVEEIDEEPGTTSSSAAWETAAAKLLKYCRDSRRFSYQTNDNGLRPGQIQYVIYPLLTLSGYMLIESVSAVMDGEYMLYDVVCITGPEMGSWSQLFKRLADQAKLIMDRINVGLDTILVIMSTTDEEFGWAESVDQDVYACSVPAADLYPADTGLYPC